MGENQDDEDPTLDAENIALERGSLFSERLTGEPLLLPPSSSVPPAPKDHFAGAVQTRDGWGAAQAERRGFSSLPPAADAMPRTAEPPEAPPDPWGDLSSEMSVVTLAGPSVDALGLADRAPAPLAVPDDYEEMREKYALGDFSGALRVAEMLSGQSPDDTEVAWYLTQSQVQLRGLLMSKLGEESIPIVIIPVQELQWYGLDPASFKLLSKMDGVRCVNEVVRSSVLPDLEALRSLGELVAQGIVRLDEPIG